MGDAGALGQASRARGVHDAEDILVVGRVGLNHVVLAGLAELLEGDDGEVRVVGLESFELATLGKVALLVDDYDLDLGLLDGLGGGLEQVRVDVHGLGVSLVEGVGDAALAEGVVGGDDGDGLGSTGMGDGGPVGAGGGEEVQSVLGAEAIVAQTGADLEDQLLILLVGEERVLGELKELPLLVDLLDLAVDVLLDLFRLLVELDQLAGANSIVVGVETGAATDNVPDGVDFLGRAVEQAVLRAGVTARDGLAGDLFDAGSLDGEGGAMDLGQGHDARSVVRHDGDGVGRVSRLWRESCERCSWRDREG